MVSWYGFFAPAGTPVPVLDTLNRGINEALSDPEARARIVKFNLEPMGGTRDEFDRTVRSQITRWAGVIKTAGIEPD